MPDADSLAMGIAQIESIHNGVALVLQALPRGQRRRLKVRLPFMATVDNAGPKPRQSAYGPATRGEVNVDAMEVTVEELSTQRFGRGCFHALGTNFSLDHF